MTWMLTANGNEIDLAFIAEGDGVRIEDIAHHLSQINRYCGACSRPYSVAEHSLLVVEILERHLGETRPEVLMAGLLHDAHEAYVSDLPQPMKMLLGSPWELQEDRIAWVVRERFGVGKTAVNYAGVIKQADLIALSTERMGLMPPGEREWPVLCQHPPVRHDFAGSATWSWMDWRSAFLERFGELRFAMDEAKL